MKRKLLVAIPLLCAVGLFAFLLRPKHESLSDGYISERSATLWSSVAQVREPIGTLHYGDKVEVIAHRNDSAKIRTAGGEVGWLDGHSVMDPALWQRSAKLLSDSRSMTVQARGRTKVQTNLRVLPGRLEPRLYQFGRGVPVEIVGRSVADWVQGNDGEKEPSSEPSSSKKEDWLLVRAVATRPPGESTARLSLTNTTQPGDQSVPIAGWVVSRFVELDLPDPVREELVSANVRAIAWFELNRVSDPSGDKPQYLVAGTRGPEGQSCDFKTLRVYTWNLKRSRYETAFIENNLCGKLPIHVGKSPKNEPEFRFYTADEEKEERVYRLMQTVVRRIRDTTETPRKSGNTHAKRAAK
jgi:hypothetical protein